MHRRLFLLALVSLCACQTAVSARSSGSLVPAAPSEPIIQTTSTPQATLTPPPMETGTPSVPAEQEAWSGSPHGLLAAGTAAVPCTDCHEKVGGVINGSQIAWWDAAAQRYQSVADANGLCLKCHQQPLPASEAGTSPDAVHAGFECTACHNAHTTIASCTNSSCHSDVRQTNDLPPATPSGGHPQVGNPFCGGRNCHPAATAAAMQPRSVHGAAHVNVSCQACHASGDLTAGPGPNGGQWVIWQAANAGAGRTEQPFFPHAIQTEVNCQRCHFSNNPWGLPLVTGSEFQR